MKVTFWGTRGSLPASVTAKTIRAKIKATLETVIQHGPPDDGSIDTWIDWALPFSVWGTFGTNTPCIQIETDPANDTPDEYVLCDAGTGLRDFAGRIMATRGPANPATYHIFMSHLHWDHIQGFPFFVPAYIPGNTIHIYGAHQDMERAFTIQHRGPHFPIEWKNLGANIDFTVLDPNDTHQVAGLSVSIAEQTHPGDSYGYRLEKDGKSVVYSTDNEHKFQYLDPEYVFHEFYRDADLLIFDAQYTLKEATTTKEDWGHSNNLVAAEMAQETGVKHLCLFHQEPTADDATLLKFLEETRHYAELADSESKLRITMAYDGLVVDLDAE